MSKTPKLRFSEFSGEWQVKKLGEIAQISTGKKDTQDKNDDGKYPFFVRSQQIEKINSYSFDGEAILTAGDGAGVGKVFHYINGKFDFHQRVYKISNFSKGINGRYIYEYFRVNFIREATRYTAKTSVDSVRMEMLTKMDIPCPTFKEQEKIASFFSLIDEKIQKQQKKVETLQEYKKGIMQKIFSQEIRFKNDNGKEFPKWQTKKLGELLSIPEKIKEENISKDKLLTVKLHRSGVQVNKNTDTLDIGSTIYYRRNSGQLIYGKQNFFNGAIDIIPEELDGFLSSGDVPSLNINNSEAEPNFLLNFIGRTEFYKRTESLASGTGSKRLHENILLDIEIYIPTLDEQRKISQYLMLLNKKTLLEEKKLEVLNEWKKGLLQKMFV